VRRYARSYSIVRGRCRDPDTAQESLEFEGLGARHRQTIGQWQSAGGGGGESSPLSCIVSGVQDSRSAGRTTQTLPDPIVHKIHPSEIADVTVARRARVRVAARVGLERRHCMRARCGHCSTCASDQMLRRIIPTAERTVTRGGDKKPLTNETRLENAPYSAASRCHSVVVVKSATSREDVRHADWPKDRNRSCRRRTSLR
jgi:hypothetical protein